MTFEDFQKLLFGCDHAVAVVPNDGAPGVLATPSRRLYVGVTGDVKVDTLGGETGILFKAVPVGFLDVHATKVYATGTTATTIVTLW
jgi:hypothetical protein